MAKITIGESKKDIGTVTGVKDNGDGTYSVTGRLSEEGQKELEKLFGQMPAPIKVSSKGFDITEHVEEFGEKCSICNHNNAEMRHYNLMVLPASAMLCDLLGRFTVDN